MINRKSERKGIINFILIAMMYDTTFIFIEYELKNTFLYFSCDVPCPEGTFDKFCNQTCRCENEATCDAKEGTCDCTAGWRVRTKNTFFYKAYYINWTI